MKIEDMMKLNSDTNQYGPQKEIMSVLKKIDSKDLLGYNRSPKIIRVISKKFRISEDQIIVDDGVLGLIVFVLSNFVNKKDKVLAPEQGYHFYRKYLKVKQARVITYSFKKGNEKFEYFCEDIVKKISVHEPKVVILIDPNNPLGCSMTISDINKISKKVKKSSLIILDQAHEGFRKNRDNEIMHLIKSNPNIVVFRSFSKFYASAAMRLGFALCGSNVKKLIQFPINHKYLGINYFNDILGAYILTHEEYYKKIAKKIIKTRNNVVKIINKSELVKAYNTDNPFILLGAKKKVILRLLNEFNKNGIIVKNLMDKEDDYNMPNGKEKYLKVTIGTDDQMSEFLNVFHKTVEELKNDKGNSL